MCVCHVMSSPYEIQVYFHGTLHEMFHISDEYRPFKIDLIHTDFLRTAWDNLTATNVEKLYREFFLTQVVETPVKSVLHLNHYVLCCIVFRSLWSYYLGK
jgi:hypothetical protein